MIKPLVGRMGAYSGVGREGLERGNREEVESKEGGERRGF